MKKLSTILLLILTHVVAHSQLLPFLPALGVATTVVKVAKIDFRSSGTSTGLTNWNTLAGNPHSSVLTVSNMIDTTGASTGWSITTKATANWLAYSGCSCSSNNSVSGITGGNAMPGASTQSYQSIVFNYGTVTPARYDATKWQLEIGGLDNSKTYTIRICGSEGTLGFDNQYYVIRAVGATSTSTVEIDGGAGGGGGYTVVNNYGELTLQPSSGIIKIWINTEASGAGGSSDLAVISSMRITQN